MPAFARASCQRSNGGNNEMTLTANERQQGREQYPYEANGY
jgi:hypothetical protein